MESPGSSPPSALTSHACLKHHQFLPPPWPPDLLPSVPFSSVQLLSHVRLFATPWTAARQPSLSITNSQSLLRLMSIKSMMPSHQLILCRPLLLPSLFPSIRVFSKQLALLIWWPKEWSSSINLSNEYSGVIFFRFDWFDLLAVQGALKSLLQHNLKASVLQSSAFFMAQLSQLDMTPERKNNNNNNNIALSIQIDLCGQSDVSAF